MDKEAQQCADVTTKPRSCQEIPIQMKNFDELMNHNENPENTAESDFHGDYARLESINDDCLRYIVKYLNFMDVMNLSATCPRLLQFAETSVFPMKANTICIELNMDTVTKISAQSDPYPSKFQLDDLRTPFGSFGEFVKDLKFIFISNNTTSFSNSIGIMRKCTNLGALRFEGYQFITENVLILPGIFKCFQNLKELDFRRCTGLTNNWPALHIVSKVQKLSLTATDRLSVHFFKYFHNLVSLSIDFTYNNNVWREEDIAMIPENIGHSLKHSKLSLVRGPQVQATPVHGLETFIRLIKEHILDLDSLELNIQLSSHSIHMTELAHLKSVHLDCSGPFCYSVNLNLPLRTLSNNGIIEEISISYGSYDPEDEKLPPLVFNNLHRFELRYPKTMISLLKAMTRSQMSAILTFNIQYIGNQEDDHLLKFIESKKTLKSIQLINNLYGNNLTFAFVHEIIDILKKQCLAKRPFLKIGVLERGMAEEIDLLYKQNQHLIEMIFLLRDLV